MEAPHRELAIDARAVTARTRRSLRIRRTGNPSGHSAGELAIIGVTFLMMVFGVVDFGRAIFLYARFEHSVRAAARYGEMHPTATTDIAAIVLVRHAGLDIRPADIAISCASACAPGSANVTVSATARFFPVTAKLLGIGPDDLPIRLHASATAP
jgi:Flp pilus assembly protein TadG